MKILQIGLGGFGRNHLRAWHELGRGADLYIAEARVEQWAECAKFNLPKERLTTDFRQFLSQVDVVDVVTPSDSHFALCSEALNAGKDVFVEKPMTMTSAEAVELAKLTEKNSRILQVGYYYRFHQLAGYAKEQIDSKRLGDIRYVTGDFMGFKRARTDVGVTHTDAIHFLDLFNSLVGFPTEVYAVTRDHFGRGLEDFSIVLLTYPNGIVGKVESGYIQPGEWKDKVVADAMTTKRVVIVGSRATLTLDFETEIATCHDVHHEKKDGVWWARVGEASHPNLGTATPIQLVAKELTAFLECVRTRQQPLANARVSGVALAVLMEALYESARTNQPRKIQL